MEIKVRWRKGQALEPDWKIDQDGWVLRVDGRPTVRNVVSFLPPPDFRAETIADIMTLGHIMTAMPVINAIPVVVACAEPVGCRTLATRTEQSRRTSEELDRL